MSQKISFPDCQDSKNTLKKVILFLVVGDQQSHTSHPQCVRQRADVRWRLKRLDTSSLIRNETVGVLSQNSMRTLYRHMNRRRLKRANRFSPKELKNARLVF